MRSGDTNAEKNTSRISVSKPGIFGNPFRPRSENKDLKLERAITTGIVKKTGEHNSTWKKRFLVLFPKDGEMDDKSSFRAELSYFKEESSSEPQGTIRLQRDSVVKNEGTTLGEQFVFSVKLHEKHERTYNFSCEQQEEQENWIRMIRQVIDSLIPPEQLEQMSKRNEEAAESAAQYEFAQFANNTRFKTGTSREWTEEVISRVDGGSNVVSQSLKSLEEISKLAGKFAADLQEVLNAQNLSGGLNAPGEESSVLEHVFGYIQALAQLSETLSTDLQNEIDPMQRVLNNSNKIIRIASAQYQMTSRMLDSKKSDIAIYQLNAVEKWADLKALAPKGQISSAVNPKKLSKRLNETREAFQLLEAKVEDYNDEAQGFRSTSIPRLLDMFEKEERRRLTNQNKLGQAFKESSIEQIRLLTTAQMKLQLRVDNVNQPSELQTWTLNHLSPYLLQPTSELSKCLLPISSHALEEKGPKGRSQWLTIDDSKFLVEVKNQAQDFPVAFLDENRTMPKLMHAVADVKKGDGTFLLKIYDLVTVCNVNAEANTSQVRKVRETGSTYGSEMIEVPTSSLAADREITLSLGFKKFIFVKGFLRVFWNHLKAEFSEENLSFWLEAREYRRLTICARLDRQSPEAIDPRVLLPMVTRIVNRYVMIDSEKQVNLSSDIVNSTLRRLVEFKNLCEGDYYKENPHSPELARFDDLIDEAQTEILSLLCNDSYKRFIQSTSFREFVENLQRKS
jgi:hypothetical protein